MKNSLALATLIAAMVLPSTLLAEPVAEVASEVVEEVQSHVIYRTRMPDGSFKLSDEPENDSSEAIKLHELPEVGTVVPRRPVAKPAPQEPAAPTFVAADYSLAISAPSDGQTFVHPDAVPVSVSLSPALPEGYRVQLLHGGQPLEGMAVQMPSRGGHQLQAQVLDAEGKVVLSSEVVSFTVLRPSRLIP